MSLPTPTLPQTYDQLYSGRKWPSITITFSFPSASSQFSSSSDGQAPGFVTLLASGKEAARLALSLWDDLIIPDFREVNASSGTVNSDLEFGLSQTSADFAYGYYPPSGSIWFNAKYGDASGPDNNLVNPVLGRHGFLTYIHEIGHALGLDHSGEYNGTGVWNPLNFHDSTVFSVMSYFGPSWGDGEGEVAWADWVGADNITYSPQTPMLNDVYVIQRVYGVETTTRLGETIYGFNSNIAGDSAKIFDFSRNKNPILTIFDSGGNDTLDLSGWSTASFIDLRQGRFSSCNSMTNNIAIAFGCDIENAIGGSGSDKITGNFLSNILKGGAGNDFFDGQGGSDQIYGGTGTDTVYFNQSSSSYQITAYQSYATVTNAGVTTVVYEVEYLQFSDNKILISSLNSAADSTAPTVLSFAPADGATNVPAGNNITLTFSENIARGTGTITLRSGSATGAIIESFDSATSSRLSISGATLTIDPTNNLSDNTNYYLVISSGNIADVAGNSFSGVSSYDFKTSSSDTTAPTVVTFAPADGATKVSAGNNITLTFSENIARGTGTITLRSGSATGTIIESFDPATSSRISISGAMLTIDPTSSLPAGTQVFVTFSDGSIKDLAGNSYSGIATYDFTTEVTVTSDDYPNSTSTSGVLLVDGRASDGQLETAGDIDAFKVTLVAGTTYIFSLTKASGSLDPRLALYDPELKLLALNNDYGSSRDSRIVFTASTGGTYYLQASDFSGLATGSYKLQVTTQPDTSSPTILSFLPADGATSVTVDSNISISFSEDIKPGTGTITLRSGSATGTIIESFDVATSSRLAIIGPRLTIDPTSSLPAGTQVFVTFSSGSIIDLAGNSYLGSSSYDFKTADASVVDDYPNSTNTNAILNIDGTPTRGAIESSGDFDFFRVTLVAGTTYTFSLINKSGSLDPYLALYDASRNVVAFNDDSTDGSSNRTRNSNIVFTANYSGIYFIRASDYEQAATGTYELRGQTSASVIDDYPDSSKTRGEVSIGGSPVTATFETTGDADRLKVTLVAGTTYAFSMRATSGSVDPNLELYGQDLQLLAENDDYDGSSRNSKIIYTATSSGVYYLRATDYNNDATGSYTLSAEIIIDDYPNSISTPGTITVNGSAADGKIEFSGDLDVFKVSLIAGTSYKFALTNASGSLDPYLELYDSDTNKVAYNDDENATTRNSVISFTAQYSGIYYLRASDYDSEAVGSYKLTATSMGANRFPAFSTPSQAVSTNEDASKVITLAATDADGDPLIYTVSSAVAKGTVSISGSTAIYTPDKDYNGTDSFVIRASDGKGGTATQTINMTVTPVNDAPVFVSASQTISAVVGTAKTITLAVADVDGDTLTYTVAMPGKGAASISGSTLTYTSATSASGSDSFAVTASDGKGGTATQTFSVTLDDYANTTSSRGVVTVGGTATKGSIEFAGDTDVFRVTLQAGVTYKFSMTATTGSLDPYLFLFDPTVTQVASNGDNGSSKNSEFTYTAPTSGSYLLSAEDTDSSVGSYTITAVRANRPLAFFNSSETVSTSTIVLDGVMQAGASTADYATASAAFGWNFITFG